MTPYQSDVERQIEFDFLRATEIAALNTLQWLDKGQKEKGDEAACDAIRGMFDLMDIRGEVVLGEGIRDEAPRLFKGKKVGTWKDGSPRFEIALYPVDDTSNVSKGMPNSLSCIAAAAPTADGEPYLSDIPAFYMKKLAYQLKVRRAWIKDSNLPIHVDAPIGEVSDYNEWVTQTHFGDGSMTKILMLFFASAVTFASPVYGEQPNWQKELDRQLPLLGHRNWIVVADSAYPSQTAPGIKTIYTGEKQLDAVRKVLAAVKKQKHVRGAVFVDAELQHVPEKFAKGIGDYRAGLKEALKGQDVTSLPHGEIIEKLDEAGQTFHVLLLKTDLTLPYTSVFIRLDCGYWSDEAEEQLRSAIEAADGSKE